jgi:hypothetical protein
MTGKSGSWHIVEVEGQLTPKKQPEVMSKIIPANVIHKALPSVAVPDTADELILF